MTVIEKAVKAGIYREDNHDTITAGTKVLFGDCGLYLEKNGYAIIYNGFEHIETEVKDA